MFKNIIAGTQEKKGIVKKKRNVNDFCKGNIRQLSYRKIAKGRIEFIL
jgi:hypothetical protein